MRRLSKVRFLGARSVIQKDPLVGLSAQSVRQRARELLCPVQDDGSKRLPPVVPTGPGDDELNPGALTGGRWSVAGDAATALRPAAVLIGILNSERLDVVFTQRTPHLTLHAGQISFPGGKIDASDAGASDAALREAEEEIGLDRQLVEPLGFLDTYRTGTGYAIRPLIGMVDPSFTPAANPCEVADVFMVPLAFLMAPDNMKRHSTQIGDRVRHFHAIPFEERFIWGATAGILKNMRERLF